MRRAEQGGTPTSQDIFQSPLRRRIRRTLAVVGTLSVLGGWGSGAYTDYMSGEKQDDINLKYPKQSEKILISAQVTLATHVKKECKETVEPKYKTIVENARNVIEQEKTNRDQRNHELAKLYESKPASPLVITIFGIAMLGLAGIVSRKENNLTHLNQLRPPK